ncbi:MAG: secretion protein HlyD [Epsilonproteobacteria bacterium]|nr:secretion protein HlyD [Campylobacterota bacterium]NPA64613.1 HlyD family efflux transporter periplasmic adaptor subunit [Campylobacterota bacterium]
MKKILPIFLAILGAVALFFIYKKLNPPKLPPNLVQAVGMIDGDLIRLGTKYPGKVQEQRAQDGMPVQKSQLIAALDSKEYQAQKRAVEAKIKAQEQEKAAAAVDLAIAQKSLPQNVKKAKSSLKANEAKLQELQKNIDSLKAVVAQDKKDYNRYKKLYAQNLIQKHLLEQARLKLISDQNRLKALYDQKKALQSAIEAARSTLAQAKSELKRVEALERKLQALGAKIKATKANLAQVEAILRDLNLTSPIEGFVVEKVAQVGEMLPPGGVVATLIDPKTLYLKIFVDTIHTGKIKIGDKGVIFLDAYPNRPIEARVTHVAQKAEFTPKEVAVRSDRIQRVYAVKLTPTKPNPLLKLGLPATGVVSLNGKGLPRSLDELPPL